MNTQTTSWNDSSTQKRCKKRCSRICNLHVGIRQYYPLFGTSFFCISFLFQKKNLHNNERNSSRVGRFPNANAKATLIRKYIRTAINIPICRKKIQRKEHHLDYQSRSPQQIAYIYVEKNTVNTNSENKSKNNLQHIAS